MVKGLKGLKRYIFTNKKQSHKDVFLYLYSPTRFGTKTHFLWLGLILLILSQTAFAISPNSQLPPIDSRFRVRVNFWKKVYTEIDSKSAFIHDKEKIGVIYKKTELKASTYKQRAKSARQEVQKIKNILTEIYKKNLQNLNSEENEILKIAQFQNRDEVKEAIQNVRAQYGLKDNYYIGLKRSHRYLDFIKKTFKEYGLPDELIYLPHVESSFNYRAYSKVGAAGIWQFMRSTGRLFGLKYTYVIDERRDPFKATVAAAKLLRSNYDRIKNWPLAITGYNHGIQSMERALEKVGSGEIADIIERYDGRRFGFASKNFYATFIATVEISEDPAKYFPEFQKPEPFRYSAVNLPKALTIKQIKKATGLDDETLKLYNPSIRNIAYRTSLQVPKGFALQIPKTTEPEIQNYLAQLEKQKSYSENLEVTAVHKIQKGDSLYTLAKIYGVSIHDIIVFNQIANPSRIYPGMNIKIPGSKELAMLKQNKQVALADPIPEKKAVVAVSQTTEVTDTKPVIKPATSKEVLDLNYDEEKAKKDPNEIAKVHKKLSWFDKLFKSKEEIEQAKPIEEVEKVESEIEDKSTEQLKSLVSLDNYNLEIKNLSDDLYEITIETDETLGHYADWAIIKIINIRAANRMNSRSVIRVGQKLKLRLTPDQYQNFVAKRAEYHLSIQEDFYQSFRITGVMDYSVQTGDTLNQILQNNEVPLWLFRKYQPKDFNPSFALKVGQMLKLPSIEQVGNSN